MFKKASQLIIIFTLMFFAITPVSNAEEKYNIKEMTPEVKAALEGRRSRYQSLNDFKIQGFIGESNKGYVYSFSDREVINSIVIAENRDRKIIYMTIAQQNNLSNALATIERIFAKEQHQRALPGVKIQNQDGTWITK